MAWKISGQHAQWAAYDGHSLTADLVTRATIEAMAGQPIPLTPTGPCYEPNGPTDPVWLYLAATSAVPGPRSVAGDPPPPPALPPLEPGLVY